MEKINQITVRYAMIAVKIWHKGLDVADEMIDFADANGDDLAFATYRELCFHIHDREV